MGSPTAKVNAKPLRDLVNIHDIEVPVIASHTGISRSTLYSWLREGEMPKHMQATCIGVLQMVKGHGTRTDKPMVASEAPEHLLVVRLPEGASNNEAIYNVLRLAGAKYQPLDKFDGEQQKAKK